MCVVMREASQIPNGPCTLASAGLVINVTKESHTTLSQTEPVGTVLGNKAPGFSSRIALCHWVIVQVVHSVKFC